MIRRVPFALVAAVVTVGGTWAVVTYGAPVLLLVSFACVLPKLFAELGTRRFLLAITLLTLAAARLVQLVPVSGIENLRYVAVVALVAVTWREAAAGGKRVKLAELPRNARLLVTALWLLSFLAVASIAWSIAPKLTALQTGAFMLLVVLVHLSLKLWRDRAALVSDLQVIYFTLAATILAGFAVPRDRNGRMGGLYNNPNGLAQITVLTALIGIGLYAETRRRLFLLGTAPLLVVLVLTESRTAVIAFVVGGIFFVVKGGARSLLRAALAVTVVLLGGVLFHLPLPSGIRSVVGRFTEAVASGDPLNGRGPVWDYALLLWHRQPLTGYGFRTGDVLFEANRALTDVEHHTVAHSSYLQMLLELGVLGMVPLAILIFAAIKIITKTRAHGLERALAACIVAGLLIGLAESSMFGIGQPFAWVLWIAAAAASAQAGAGTPNRDEPSLSVSADGSLSRQQAVLSGV